MKFREKFFAKLNTADKRKFIEISYLVVLMLYLLKISIGTTMMDIRFPTNYDVVLRIITCAVVLLKTSYSDVCKGKEWFCCITVGICFCLSWVSTGYAFLLDTPLLIIGAFGMDYRKILTAGFWVELYVLLTALLGSLAGVFIDLVYSNKSHPEHSFGAVYTTDFAAHVAYLILIAWVLAGPVLYPLLLAFSVGVIAFLIQYNGSRCSIIVLCISVLVMFYTVYIRKHLRRLPKGTLWNVAKVSVISIPAIVMLILTWAYDGEKVWMSQIDAFLSNRLNLGKNAIVTYGLKMFGTPFNMTGSGGSTSYHFSYNFVDCSYVMVLVRYGWVMLLVLCTLGLWTAYKALRAGSGILYWAVALVFLHSMIEHHLPELAYNLFLLTAFTRIEDTSVRQEETVRLKEYLSKKNMIKLGWYGIIFVILLFGSTRGHGYIRALAYILHLSWQPRYIWFVIIATMGFTALIVFLGLSGRLIDRVLERKKSATVCCSVLILIMLFLGVGVFVKCSQILDRGRIEYEALIETDRPYIEALGTAGVEVCVDELPAIYGREFNNIRYTLLNRDGLAIKENTTLFINDSEELQLLMDNDFWYGELPGDRAVYTNNPAAKETLEQSGVTMQDYYGKWRTVDLWAMAQFNGLDMTEGGGLLLEGPAKSLACGPWVSIVDGFLRVEYKLRMIQNAFDIDQVMTARISVESGTMVMKEVNVSQAEFDENGECTLILDTGLWDKFNNIEFLLFPADGVSLEVEQIGYGKIG